MKKCKSCNSPVKTMGYCGKHYMQVLRHGRTQKYGKHESNQIIYCKNYCKIVLRDKNYQIAGYALVDKKDIEKISPYKWCLNGYGYVVTRARDGVNYLHKLILEKTIKEVDHINRDPLDNRRKNLRAVTSSQNKINRGVQTNNKSGFSGVGLIKQTGKWRAYIKIEKRQIHLGNYGMFEDAIKARKKAEKKYFGEYSPV